MDRPGRSWRRARALILAAIGLATAGCAARPASALVPHGPVASIELGLMGESLWIMVAIFGVVTLSLTYILIRYRARSGDNGDPPQVEGNHTLEIVWTVVPILLLVMLIVPTVHETFVLAGPPPTGSDPLEVVVVGHQWWWEFDYPAQHIVTADELRIPTGARVDIVLRSADVLHSFWVPSLGGKQTAVPGQESTMWLEASSSGTYPGQCAEFCGLSHSLMRFDVVAQPAAAFAAWVSGMQHPVVTPQGALATTGQQLFAANGCGACHAIDGTSAQGTVGPNLTGLGNRAVVVAGALANTPADVERWIHDPGALLPGTVMPPFPGLSTDQLQALAAYLEGLK